MKLPYFSDLSHIYSISTVAKMVAEKCRQAVITVDVRDH
jgi:hypothetical protein